MSKPKSIAPVPRPTPSDASMQQFVDAVKQNLDVLTGQQPSAGDISPLKADADLAEVIRKLNAVIDRLGG